MWASVRTCSYGINSYSCEILYSIKLSNKILYVSLFPQSYLFFAGLVVFMSFLYGLISLAAIYGNSLVIWVVSTVKNLQNENTFYLANLAISDVIIALFCIPFQFYAALLQRWDLPKFMCKFCPFTQTFSVNVSIFTLIAIAQLR